MSKADQTYMKNLIRSLERARDRHLNLADENREAITAAQLKLIAIEMADKLSEIDKLLNYNFTVETDSVQAEEFCEWLFEFIEDDNKILFYDWIMNKNFHGCSEQFIVAVMMRINTLSKDLNIGIICSADENSFREKRNNVARKLRPIAAKMNILKGCAGIFDPD